MKIRPQKLGTPLHEMLYNKKLRIPYEETYTPVSTRSAILRTPKRTSRTYKISANIFAWYLKFGLYAIPQGGANTRPAGNLQTESKSMHNARKLSPPQASPETCEPGAAEEPSVGTHCCLFCPCNGRSGRLGFRGPSLSRTYTCYASVECSRNPPSRRTQQEH